MTRVDFYILGDTGGRELLACRLAEKAYHAGHRVGILAQDPEQARDLDDLLWSFRQGSFVPHELHGSDASEEPAPVTIVWAGGPAATCEVLINLDARLPPDPRDYQRVVEIVDQDPEVLAASRARFRAYREDGLEPQSHRL